MLEVKQIYIKLRLVNILENVFVFIEILFKMLLFKWGVYSFTLSTVDLNIAADDMTRWMI